MIADGAIAILLGGLGHHLYMIKYILSSPSHTENQPPAIHARTSIPPLSSAAFSNYRPRYLVVGEVKRRSKIKTIVIECGHCHRARALGSAIV